LDASAGCQRVSLRATWATSLLTRGSTRSWRRRAYFPFSAASGRPPDRPTLPRVAPYPTQLFRSLTGHGMQGLLRRQFGRPYDLLSL
jgi:hypothetical protein